MFMGPNAYITPSWYSSKRAHGSAHSQESTRSNSWQLSDASAGYIEKSCAP